MSFFFFLLLVFVGYIIIRYRETTFPLIKKAFSDIQADIEKFQSKKKATASAEADMPYEVKEKFFNTAELEFFRILNSHLDAHKYTVFPKVRLADVVAVTGGNSSHYGAWNKIKSRHADYLVWNLVESKVVLAIELDGKAHDGLAATKNDEFKNELYEKVGIKLTRIKVGDDFDAEVKKIVAMLQ